MKNKIDWSKENIERSVKISFNYVECLINMGLARQKAKSGNICYLKTKIIKYDIQWPHYNPNIALGHGKTGGTNKLSYEELFRENAVVLRQKTIKKEFLKITEYQCAICGIGDVWNNKKLVLQLDHIDGNNSNNNINNLRLLCPNCHSQTETFSRHKTKNNANVA